MMTSARAVLGGLLLATSVLVTGCISLFPESDPVQLYRFGDTAPPAQDSTRAEATFNVFAGRTGFNRAAAGDRILTVNGSQVAYIKDARWVTSAEDLFDTTLQRTFDDNNGPARLVGSGDIASADYHLRLQVQAFEARYLNGQDAPPEIRVTVQATLTDTHRQTVVAEKGFSAAIGASENRVSAIVTAFDTGVSQVLGQLLAWVNARYPVE